MHNQRDRTRLGSRPRCVILSEPDRAIRLSLDAEFAADIDPEGTLPLDERECQILAARRHAMGQRIAAHLHSVPSLQLAPDLASERKEAA